MPDGQWPDKASSAIRDNIVRSEDKGPFDGERSQQNQGNPASHTKLRVDTFGRAHPGLSDQ
ncbi:hypothetical protein B7486_03005 [cyanobacterium TDX16]|nr:hypothetical protein B7486_03005 [cyanobacterium TDX16]